MNHHQVSPEVLSKLRQALTKRLSETEVKSLSDDDLILEACLQIEFMSDPYNHYTSCSGPCDC